MVIGTTHIPFQVTLTVEKCESLAVRQESTVSNASIGWVVVSLLTLSQHRTSVCAFTQSHRTRTVPFAQTNYLKPNLQPPRRLSCLNYRLLLQTMAMAARSQEIAAQCMTNRNSIGQLSSHSRTPIMAQITTTTTHGGM